MALLMPFLGTGKAMAEAKGTGTLADPYNAAGACAAVKDLTWTSNTEYESTDDVVPSLKAAHTAMRHSISRKTEQRKMNSIASASFIWTIKSLRKARPTSRSATRLLCAVS